MPYTFAFALALTLALAQNTTQVVVGNVDFESSGAPEAQKRFLFGLAQLHNFEYPSAAAAFREAQEADPDFAMAYWGEAMTENHPVWMEQDRDAALNVLHRLGATPESRLAKAKTAREKAYLQAVEVLYGEGSKHERDFAYAEAMERLYRAYPDDVNAAAFYSLAILGTAHEGRDFRIYMRAAAVAEEAFRTHPQHPGILHYLIHCYDDPIHAPLGLRPARLYAQIAPDAGHAQHMTSHIFVAMGLWNDVVAANENAAAVVNRNRQRNGRPPSHCGHYNFWLLYGYLQEGREADARKLLAACRDDAMHTERGPSVLDPDNTLLHSFLQMRARYLLDSEAWDGEAARWKIDLDEGFVPERVSYEFIESFAALSRGDVETARKKLSRLTEAEAALPRYLETHHDDSGPAVLKRAEILEAQLRALLLRSSGKKDEAIAVLEKAAQTEIGLPFMFGPPFVDEPTLELLGETLIDAGRAEEAVGAFEQALDRTPGRRAALEGLARAADLAGDAQKAGDARERLWSIAKEAGAAY